eukprot:51081-Eustigmatos_ZCMA.PRE.3
MSVKSAFTYCHCAFIAPVRAVCPGADGHMSSADDGPYKGTRTPKEVSPSCAQQQDPQPAGARCIAAHPLSQLGDAANSAWGIVRLEAEQEEPAGQPCGA